MGQAAAPIALRSARLPAHNLPAQFTSFVGRSVDRAEIGALLGESRLVSLTGAGGVGKTRLAQEVGADVLGEYHDGVWLVELGPLTDEQRVAHAIADAFGIHEEPDRDVEDTLVVALRTRRLLLVLDNCEHLLRTCAVLVRRILAGCPRVTILTTSREPLGLPGEMTWRVPSLSEADAARLFAERAVGAAPGFRATAHEGAIDQICRRLDGIPLALELAAARVSALDPAQIATRLDDRFRLLGGASRVAPARQLTLRAAIDWSYDLLASQERLLLERLAVFGGGWSLEAAEAICASGDIAADEVADVLARLVDKSLVVVEDAPYVGRWYRLLETVRAYAHERLSASGDGPTLRSRHLDWYVDFARGSDWSLRRAPDVPWTARRDCSCRVVREMDNLRAAWRWSMTDGQRDQGLRMAGWLLAFFYSIGYLSEGRDWLRQLLETGAADSLAHAHALSAAAKLAAHHGDDNAARTLGAEYLDLPPEVQEAAWTADVLAGLSIVDTRRGDLAVAQQRAQQAVEIAQSIGDPVDAAIFRTYAATAAYADGRVAEAADLYDLSLSETRRMDFQLGVALALAGLAAVARTTRDLSAARRMYAEALSVFREMGALLPAMQALIGSGHAALSQGDLLGARRAFVEALDMAVSVGQRQQMVNAVDGLLLVAAAEGRHECVIELVAASEAVRTASGGPAVGKDVEQALGVACASVGPRRAQALAKEAAAMPLEQALANARKGDTALTVVHPTVPGGLTQRELEVVQLLGQGRSNREIAETLVISVRTVDRHVENVLGKLGLGSRSQVVAWAAQKGLLNG